MSTGNNLFLVIARMRAGACVPCHVKGTEGTSEGALGIKVGWRVEDMDRDLGC